MQYWFAVAITGSLLAACSPTGQPGLQANLSEDGTTPQAGASAGYAAGGGLLGTYPARPAQTAQGEPEQVIASTFTPPKKPPVPVARPDFGDRVEVAAAPAGTAPARQPTLVTAYAAPQEAAPLQTPLLQAAPAAALPAPVEQAAQTRSIAAYERHEAGVPAEEARVQVAAVTYPMSDAQLGLRTNSGLPLAGSSSNGLSFSSGKQSWYPAYPTVETDCFPSELRQALNTIAAHYNRPVEVTSGMRNRGRRYSMHRYCKAADIRVAGVSPGALASYAKTVPGINGVGTYRWVAVTHIDTRAERFAWRY